MKKIIITITDEENVGTDFEGEMTHAEKLGYLTMVIHQLEFEAMSVK